jgi:hypothetical protein
MGWLFKNGCTRKELIRERAENWEKETNDMLVRSVCLAHCYRGGVFSGVLWAVWERTFTKDGATMKPAERWITCDLLKYQNNYGWGYKDMEESMFPYYFSCPMKYLAMVPLEQFGGHPQWRECVEQYHERRRHRCSA